MSAVHDILGIFISRGGVPPGDPLPLEEAKRSVKDGQLRLDQLAWCRGLPDWQPLQQVIKYVEKKTSTHLRVQDVPLTLNRAPATQEPVKLQPPPVTRNERPTPPPAQRPAPVKPKEQEFSSKMAAVVSAASVVAKTEIMPPDQIGLGLWSFAKQCTREFRSSLQEQMAQNGVVIHEDLDFNFSQEVLILHLWLISKVLRPDRKPVEAMNRKYIHRQSEIAQTYEHHWEQVEYMRAAKEVFLKRFLDYNRHWNDHMPRAQTMVASHLLKNIFGQFTACTKPAENLIVSFINSYLTKMPRAITAFFEEVEKKG